MDGRICLAYLCLAVTLVMVEGQVLLEELTLHGIDPLSLNGSEPYTSLTIDQIIMQALGGAGRAQNLMMGTDGKILAELDIYLTQEQYSALYDHDFDGSVLGRRKKRKAIREATLRWPNATIPYVFYANDFSDKEIYMIRSSMTEWERYTCLRFHEAKSREPNVVRFRNGAGCNSQLGMVGGYQDLNLDRNGCRYKGLYLHEIGHAIGLVHEHQLPNRDQYINILYNNVQPNMRIWFNKYSIAEVDQMNVEYEYSSVMHYGITAFSYNNKAQTIQAKFPDKEDSIGRVYKKELAFSDVKIVNLMYKCSEHCPKDIACYGRGFVDENCKCICPDGTDSCTKLSDDRYNGDQSCFDGHDSWQCYVWANQGECERNPRFMIDRCRKSCGLCGDSDKAEDPHMTLWSWQWLCRFANICPRDWSIANTCKDSYETEKCEKWKERGECVVNQKWMEKHCKKTCKACEGDTHGEDVACDNVYNNMTQCDKWASEGECFINPNWMPQNCRKSCRMCADKDSKPVTTPKPDPDAGKCEDSYNTVECRAWAERGECGKNPQWMIPNCRQSCDKCKEVGCKNLHDDMTCEMWARDGECTKNSGWMSVNCAKACGTCEANNDDRNRVPTTIPPTTTASGEVRNNHKNRKECDIWARNRHCEINDWMLVHCALSCKIYREGLLTTTTSKPDGRDGGGNDQGGKSCVDKEKHCPSWARHGFCQNNPQMALRLCPLSCDNCINSPRDCSDTRDNCPLWARAGHCRSNGGFMLRYCRKSCEVC